MPSREQKIELAIMQEVRDFLLENNIPNDMTILEFKIWVQKKGNKIFKGANFFPELMKK